MNTFQEFLDEKCPAEYETNNDPAGNEKWQEQLDVQELIDFGEEYGRYVAYETASDIQDKIATITLQLHDNK